jgi:hypothetical protein
LEKPTTEKVAKPELGMSPSLSSLRQKLGQKAKQEPKFRFYSLYDKISRNEAGSDLFMKQLRILCMPEATAFRKAGCGKSACPVVCPAKAGMFSRSQSCQGKNQKPCSLDGRYEGN